MLAQGDYNKHLQCQLIFWEMHFLVATNFSDFDDYFFDFRWQLFLPFPEPKGKQIFSYSNGKFLSQCHWIDCGLDVPKCQTTQTSF
jgi:hypothetical protein